MGEAQNTSISVLQAELAELQYQLFEARETIEAIRTGQIDALVIDEGQRQALYTLKTADQTYRVFIEKMTEGALTLNYSGIILYCNLQFAQMVGFSISDVIGMSFKEFIPPGEVAEFEQIFHKSWSNDLKAEIWLAGKVSAVPVQLSITALELEDEVALSIILTDLTTQKNTQRQLEENNARLEEMNKALEQSNHDLQQFASVASHDLQEPLRKIQMFANLLLNESPNMPDGSSGKYLEKIINSSARMKALIIDILNYSKLSAVNTKFGKVDLNELVKEVTEDFELILSEKNAVVNCYRLPVVEAIRGQIRQVFQNIISNALKFAVDGTPPVIMIDSYCVAEKDFDAPPDQDGAYCRISIRDNGIGFDEKYLSNIFTLFERLHSKDTYEGTGIGLAITKKITEKHNGMVTAKSEPGMGAEFIILLPLRQTQ